MRLTGATFHLEVETSAKEARQLILVSNHQSLMDIPLIFSVLPNLDLKFIAKTELTKFLPFVSVSLRKGGHLIIVREQSKQAIKLISGFAQQAKKEGLSIAIFPEGTRARTGGVRPFRPGGLANIIKSAPDIPVVPITVDGFWQFAFFKMMPVPFKTKLKCWVGEPRLCPLQESIEDFISSLEKEIVSKLKEFRANEKD